MKNTSNKYSNKVIRTFNLFIIIYLFLYILPFPLHYIPIIGKYFTFFHDVMEVLTTWVGKSLVGLYELKKIKFTGSGDTIFNYIEILTYLLFHF